MSDLRAGVATIDITPPIGLTMAGYGARTRPSDGIEDPLLAYALALEQGDEASAMVVGDLIGVPEELCGRIRERVEELCDLDGDRVLVCGTHTHWGPVLQATGYLPEDLREAVSEDYTATVVRQMAGAVAEAWRLREPATALAGTGHADLVKFNRRPVNAGGKTEMNLRLPLEQALTASRVGAELAETWEPGGGPGERLSEPLDELDGLRVGPANTDLPVLKLMRPDGSPLAAVMVFGCHPVCGADPDTTFYRYSADWPRYARRVVELTLGCPAMLLLGCAGDQVPVRRGGESRQRTGHSVGAEAVRVWELIEGESIGPLRIASRTVELPLRDLPSVEEARAALEATDDPEGKGAMRERHTLSQAERFEGMEAVPVQAWGMSLGEQWGLVGLPGEVLCEFELQIRQRTPFANTAVVELALGSPGYLPTDPSIDEGGYEPGWSPFGKGTEAAAVEGAVATLEECAG
ncbi:MAG: hypothetical protein U9R79_21415 [Armatimonadota bacterium]|nr:hypothetical protein [Armatimonadota bacterium]